MEEVLECVPPGSRNTVQEFLSMQRERIDKLEDKVQLLFRMINVLDTASAQLSWDLYCPEGNILDVCKQIQQCRENISFFAKEGDIEHNQVTLLGKNLIFPANIHMLLPNSTFMLLSHILTVAEHKRMREVQLDSSDQVS